MSQEENLKIPWWEELPEGRTVLLGFVKIDRKGSTREWQELSEEEVLRRRRAYSASVEQVARDFQAAQPLHWQGDGVMLFFGGGDPPGGPERAYRAARELWQRLYLELGLPLRIAVHGGQVVWTRDTGKLASPAIDGCGHLEHAAPENGVAVTEDVYLVLPERDQVELQPVGITRRDGIPAYVFPGPAAERRDASLFREDGDLALRAALRRYVLGPEVRRLRYVGFRLQRREPPSLDLLDVYVPIEVQARRRGGRMLDPKRGGITEAGGERAATAPWLCGADDGEVLPPAPFAEVFRQRRSHVLLGDPGAGKTTLLRFAAVVAARGPLAMAADLGVAERLLPILISVGRLAELRRTLGPVSVPAALARYFHDRNLGQEGALLAFLERSLEAGECLVLLDGLDEVRAEERREIHAWLETFAAGASRNRFLATSRRVGYAGIALPDSGEVVLQGFDDSQVERYIKAFSSAYVRWELGHADEAAAADAARGLLEALKASPRLQALARNPFLLSALALIHRAEGRLPRHRVQVYEIFARALCETWGSVRRLVPGREQAEIPYEEEAIPILGELALRMHERYPAGVAPESFVIEVLAEALAERKGVERGEAQRVAREFLRRAGEEVQILYERGPGEWAFLHLTFQEFFAAAGLHATERFEEVALRHAFESRWEEVIRLGVGYYALVQKRPEAARRFVEKVLRLRGPRGRSWLVSVLGKNVRLAALLAAEAEEALPAKLQQEIAGKFVEWIMCMPSELIRSTVRELTRSDFGRLLIGPLATSLNEHQSEKQIFLLQRTAWAAPDDSRVGTLVEALVAGLSDPNLRVRANVIGAFPALLSLLHSRETIFPEVVAEALGNLQAEEAVEPLLERIEMGDIFLQALWQIADALPPAELTKTNPPAKHKPRKPPKKVRNQ